MKDLLGIVEAVGRLKEPTPKFFKKLRIYCALIGAISGALIAAPVTLPAAIITLAGYGLTVGIVGAGISSLPKEDKPK